MDGPHWQRVQRVKQRMVYFSNIFGQVVYVQRTVAHLIVYETKQGET